MQIRMRSLLIGWLSELDRIIRGEATRPQALREGGGIDISPGGVSTIILVLGLIYGLCMGAFALFKEGGPNAPQIIASAIKVPLLFFLTLLVTFPSLYVFNALVGSRLSLGTVLRLLIAGMAVMGALLASFGPIVAFFSASTTSYAFMKLLNVLVFTVAGILGLRYLLTTLHRLTIAIQPAPEPEPESQSTLPQQNPWATGTPAAGSPATAAAADQAGAATAADSRKEGTSSPVDRPSPAMPAATYVSARMPGALDASGDTMGRDVTTVFRIWVIVFGLVGAQMAWVLRPFIGAPGIPFTWFRARESNFFEAVLQAIGSLFGGG